MFVAAIFLDSILGGGVGAVVVSTTLIASHLHLSLPLHELSTNLDCRSHRSSSVKSLLSVRFFAVSRSPPPGADPFSRTQLFVLDTVFESVPPRRLSCSPSCTSSFRSLTRSPNYSITSSAKRLERFTRRQSSKLSSVSTAVRLALEDAAQGCLH